MLHVVALLYSSKAGYHSSRIKVTIYSKNMTWDLQEKQHKPVFILLSYHRQLQEPLAAILRDYQGGIVWKWGLRAKVHGSSSVSRLETPKLQVGPALGCLRADLDVAVHSSMAETRSLIRVTMEFCLTILCFQSLTYLFKGNSLSPWQLHVIIQIHLKLRWINIS